MNKIYIILLTVFFYANVYSQQAYFVDGYHGGIYGHYPVKWKTQFIVDQLAMHPDWRICMEIEPETWDTVRVQTPEAYLRFKEMATSDQVEFTNPTYAQPYCYNISGESIIRQFQYGIAKRCRDIVLLSRMEGLKYMEISERLGISVNTVELSLIHICIRTHEEVS